MHYNSCERTIGTGGLVLVATRDALLVLQNLVGSTCWGGRLAPALGVDLIPVIAHACMDVS